MMAAFVPGVFELFIMFTSLAFVAVVFVLPCWLICEKAGFPGWYSLATLVPLLNVLLLFFLAFAEWPALRRDRPTDPDADVGQPFR